MCACVCVCVHVYVCVPNVVVCCSLTIDITIGIGSAPLGIPSIGPHPHRRTHTGERGTRCKLERDHDVCDGCCRVGVVTLFVEWGSIYNTRTTR